MTSTITRICYYIIHYCPHSVTFMQNNSLHTLSCLQQLKTIHEKYHQMKVELAGEGATRPVKAFDVIDSNFDDTVQEYVLVFCNRSYK